MYIGDIYALLKRMTGMRESHPGNACSQVVVLQSRCEVDVDADEVLVVL